MRIYTLSQPNLLLITTKTIEPIYVENVPYSLQMELNIPRNIVINNYKGNQTLIKVSGRTISGTQATKIIKVLNGYSKTHNYIVFR